MRTMAQLMEASDDALQAVIDAENQMTALREARGSDPQEIQALMLKITELRKDYQRIEAEFEKASNTGGTIVQTITTPKAFSEAEERSGVKPKAEKPVEEVAPTRRQMSPIQTAVILAFSKK